MLGNIVSIITTNTQKYDSGILEAPIEARRHQAPCFITL